MKEYGFYMYFKGQDNFFKSNHQRLTKAIISVILCLLLVTFEIFFFLFEVARKDIYKATYEEKAISTGRKYCDIMGKNFGCGDFLDNYNSQHYYILSE